MTVEVWQHVRRELDRWSDQGLKAKIWVRDDDACEISDQLMRLRSLADRHGINIGLAVIPGMIRDDLVEALPGMQNSFHPMCHGWVHANYGQPGRPEEFGDGRPLSALRHDAEQAFKAFSGYFGSENVIFVPPFGRVTDALVNDLPRIGFSGLSVGPGLIERTMVRLNLRFPWTTSIKLPVATIATRSSVPRLDVQVDVIDWGRRTARDRSTVAAELVANLYLRRKGLLPCDHPVGLLTHHLAHDEPIWQLCDEVLGVLTRHDAVEPVSAALLQRPVPSEARRQRTVLQSADTSAFSRPG
jgi:peptidoglycan/xylan/chitin deacetylase (PgdA/CDA1 family)